VRLPVPPLGRHKIFDFFMVVTSPPWEMTTDLTTGMLEFAENDNPVVANAGVSKRQSFPVFDARMADDGEFYRNGEAEETLSGIPPDVPSLGEILQEDSANPALLRSLGVCQKRRGGAC
jgi:hypothetical protein